MGPFSYLLLLFFKMKTNSSINNKKNISEDLKMETECAHLRHSVYLFTPVEYKVKNGDTTFYKQNNEEEEKEQQLPISVMRSSRKCEWLRYVNFNPKNVCLFSCCLCLPADEKISRKTIKRNSFFD